MSEHTVNTCRLCKKSEYSEDGSTLIKYGVRHYAHADCALKKWGASFFDRLSPWQASQFPALAAIKHGVVDALRKRMGQAL